MKKILFVLPLLVVMLSLPVAAGSSFINPCIFKSSHTRTSDTTKEISSTKHVKYLRSVIVSSPTADGWMTIYNSRGAASNEIGTVDLGTANQYNYDLSISSGLTYTTSGNANGVTILYQDKE